MRPKAQLHLQIVSRGKTTFGGWSGVVGRDQKWKWKMFSPEAGHRITGENERVV